MKKSLLFLSLSAMSFAASAQSFSFTDDIRLNSPKVSDQQNSGTCWCFSSLSFMESEMMFFGNPNPPNLSEMFVVRQNYIDRGDKHVMLHGKMNFGQGSYFLENFIIAKEYGLVPESAFPNTKANEQGIDHSGLEERATAMIDSVADDNRKKVPLDWRDKYIDLIDSYFVPCPSEFKYEGKKYTPRTFADSVVRLNFDDYIQVTSFTHHPYYQNFALEIPDNWRWLPFYNLPLDEMVAVLDHALESGHTVLWAADVSETGFSVYKGYAMLPGIPQNSKAEDIEAFRKMPYEKQILRARTLNGPGVEISVTPESRQTDFLNRNTTDDHGMHITGKAHDQFGNKFYIVKNSWGVVGKYNGYFYVSEAYVKAKTTGLCVHKSALDCLKTE